MNRRTFIATAVGGLALAGPAALFAPASAEARPGVEVWKSPSCGCCQGWVDHMRLAGFAVEVHETDDLGPVKQAVGVPDALASCHTARIGGYVIEGHVPARDVMRLLEERPVAKGLAVPGMPMDAPGMDGATGEPFDVVLFGAARGDEVFSRY